MNLATFINWFIHPERKKDASEYKKARLFVRASLLTSLFSNSYIWLSVYFEFQLGVNLMIFNVLGFLALSLLVRTRIPILFLGHLYVFVGGFAIIILTYYSGGLWSAIYPWIISIPVLALLVVNRNAGIFWGLVSFGIMVWIGLLAIQGVALPIQYNLEMKTEWFVSIIPGLLLIIMVVSMVFESEQRKAVSDLEDKNEVLALQKATIEKQTKDLEKLLDEKDQIIRIMAHDLKNPLANISSLSELLKDMKSPKDQIEIIGMIEQVTGKAQHLIAKVLDMAILEQGGIVIHVEELDLLTIINDAIDELRELGNRKNISISLESDVNSCTIRSDKTYLLLVFENLISNALKFSNREASVSVKVHRTGDKVQVKVMDEGPGVKPEEEHLLFKKFSILSARPTAGENSTGIGLSLVKTYLEKLNGKIWHERTQSKGATFIVELPM